MLNLPLARSRARACFRSLRIFCLGRLCKLTKYDFAWPAGADRPSLKDPEGKPLGVKMRGEFVPMLAGVSFDELEIVEEFETHANAVLQSHVSSTERKQVMAYLSQVLASDAQAIDAEMATAVRKRRVRRKQEKALRAIHKAHPYSYLKTPVPFTQSNLTDTQIAALLTNDDVDVSIGPRTLTTDLSGAGLDAATSFLNITGDRVSLRGTGVTGSALDGSLQCTCVINGQIQIGGSDVVLEGIRFISHLPASIAFNATCANLTIRNCIFESRALYRHADNIGGSVFLYGGDDFAGGQFSGNFTLENCRIGGGGAHSFGSWMLADLTSGSSQPPPASLRHVVLRNNKFVDCAGSFACRSKADDPALSFTATGNRFEYQPTGDYAQHPLFWSALEVNNCPEGGRHRERHHEREQAARRPARLPAVLEPVAARLVAVLYGQHDQRV